MLNETDLLEITADIVSAYVSNNPLPVGELPNLIASVNAALHGVGQPAIEPGAELVPAVNPKRSVFPDYIVCLDDGKKFKSLKRHIRTDFGLTPDAYRAKWGLPHDYPMVAQNYAAARSALAKASGLGRKPAPAAPFRKPVAKRKGKA
ncbi:MucR family transcriptional regulator [Mesorhizobium sp. INR15]|uniref:MucR family transcriptional regulator n=1 Tax=Mesorhizobium sp. INR15 TaxID=2654248 RepID=UPI0021563549|nr:MucR family transcriptional regulator [Mesorhizobium sp. INR15]